MPRRAIKMRVARAIHAARQLLPPMIDDAAAAAAFFFMPLRSLPRLPPLRHADIDATCQKAADAYARFFC